ncbi:MAG: pyridoxamine 5'-phosphate oxidase family protein [Bacteroidota bacterium]
MSLNDYFDAAILELKKGISQKKHPFRYFTLASLQSNTGIGLRTVVLRKVEENLDLIFYTDKRSAKIEEIKIHPGVSALFYHPKKLLQLKIVGKAEFIEDSSLLNTYWNGIPPKARRDYTTHLAPGTEIKTDHTVDFSENENHFAMVRIQVDEIELVQLQRPEHMRARFRKAEDGQWDSFRLVP